MLLAGLADEIIDRFGAEQVKQDKGRIKPGEEILVGNGRRFRVLDVVPFDDADSPFVAMLRVAAA